jgi:CRP-like cAMP-binding protein
MPITKLISSCELFKGFSESGLVLISKISRERVLPAGTPVFVENMVSDSMFIIKSGIVRISFSSAEGKDRVIEKITTPEAFGELSLLVGGKRMVTATTDTQCELIEISRREFVKLQNQKPQACLKLLINIVKRFGNNISYIQDHLKPLLITHFEK